MSRAHTHLIPEIQGLRAVAVLSVLIYHIWPKLLPGGYVGVDVFFVISGYLITGSLFREFETSGRISVAGFYARRIRRLLPAATLVSFTVALCLPLFPRSQWADIASSITASALYVQNWLLAAQAVDYLADDAKGPMIHFWSLSVEEQYYIVWPLLLLPLLSLARKVALSPRAAFGWFIGLIAAGSLAYSVYLTRQDAGLAYFVTTTRAWELAIGGALGVFQSRLVLSDRLRAVSGLAGLGAIVLACLAYSDATPFPGYAALLPTLGAAAVILSSGAQAPWSAHRVLNSRLFQYVGDVSYSLYLWHWPLIVLYGQVTGKAIGLRGGAALAVASFALAHLSKVFVEDYFRTVRFPPGRTIAAGMGCVAVIATMGAGYVAFNARGQNTIAGVEGLRGARAMTDPRYDWRKEDVSKIVPQPENAMQDVPAIYASKCHQSQSGTEVLTCAYGNPNSKLKIVMVGDSHAGHLYPAFEEIVRNNKVYFRGVSKSACLFSLEAVYNPTYKRPYTECLEWSKNVIEWLGRERPDIVLIAQSPGYTMTVTGGMIRAWTRLIEMGLDVRAVRSTPWLSFEPSKCIPGSKDWLKDCVPSRNEVFTRDPTLATAKALKVNVLDFTKYLCTDEQCPTVIGGVLVYRDRHHFTATFAKTLSSAMAEQLSLEILN